MCVFVESVLFGSARGDPTGDCERVLQATREKEKVE